MKSFVLQVWSGPSAARSLSSLNVTSFPASQRNIEAATAFIESLTAEGSTNVNDALISAINVALSEYSAGQHKRADPIILFLTDGYPTSGVRNRELILSNVLAANKDEDVPIYSLAFGQGVEFPFLRKLSLQNGGMARRIYEAADAALQLENFYSEISFPALSDISFTYTSDLFNVVSLTRTEFPRFFKGSEIIVAGKLEPKGPCLPHCAHGSLLATSPISSQLESEESSGLNEFDVTVTGTSVKGIKVLNSADVVLCDDRIASAANFYRVEAGFVDQETEGDGFMERLWAYLTVKQLLVKAEANNSTAHQNGSAPDNNPAQHALDLALEVSLTRFFFVFAKIVTNGPFIMILNTVPIRDTTDLVGSSQARFK